MIAIKRLIFLSTWYEISCYSSRFSAWVGQAPPPCLTAAAWSHPRRSANIPRKTQTFSGGAKGQAQLYLLAPGSSARMLISLGFTLSGHLPLLSFIWIPMISTPHRNTYIFLIILQVHFVPSHGPWDLWWIETTTLFALLHQPIKIQTVQTA